MLCCRSAVASEARFAVVDHLVFLLEDSAEESEYSLEAVAHLRPTL